MTTNLKQTQQRTQQYWFVDGWTELGLGVFCLILGGMFWLQGLLAWSPLSYLAFFAVVFGAGYGLRWLLGQVKERTTYQRTGYLAYKRGWGSKSRATITILFAVLLLALMIFLILQGPQTLVWTPALAGLIFAFIFGGIAQGTAQYRFYLLAGLSLLAGIGLSLAGLGDMSGAALLSGLVGLILLAFGGWTRRLYLQATETQSGGADES